MPNLKHLNSIKQKFETTDVMEDFDKHISNRIKEVKAKNETLSKEDREFISSIYKELFSEDELKNFCEWKKDHFVGCFSKNSMLFKYLEEEYNCSENEVLDHLSEHKAIMKDDRVYLKMHHNWHLNDL